LVVGESEVEEWGYQVANLALEASVLDQDLVMKAFRPMEGEESEEKVSTLKLGGFVLVGMVSTVKTEERELAYLQVVVMELALFRNQ
jgi:hypothetical protein